MTEAAVERTTGGVEKRWVELPRFKICVSAKDTSISNVVFYRREYEPHLTALLGAYLSPGQSFLDLGANVGYHTLTAAAIVGPAGRCTAVEMSPDNCELLRDSVAANGFSHVRVVNCAVSDAPGTLTFALGTGTTNGTVISDAMRPQLNGDWLGAPQTVEARAVDDLFEQTDRVDLIKMDVEGSEVRALKGMRRLIERCRPPVAFEFFPNLLQLVAGGEGEELLQAFRAHGGRLNEHRRDPRSEGEELLQAFRAHGYRLHLIGDDGQPSASPVTDAEAIAETRKPGGLPHIDLLALPG